MERFEKEKAVKEILEAHRFVKDVPDIWIAKRILDAIEGKKDKENCREEGCMKRGNISFVEAGKFLAGR